jgi:subtilisin family serine protease
VSNNCILGSRIFRSAIVVMLLLVGHRALSQQLSTGPQPGSSTLKYAPDRILVKFKPTIRAEARVAVHEAVGAHTFKQYAAVRNLESIALPATLDVPAALRAYRSRSEVEYAEPDYIVHLFTTPDDPLFPQMWNLLNTGQDGGTSGADIGATLAWNLSTGNHTIVITTLDTGIDYNHPDLIPNLFHNTAVCNGVNDGTNGCYGIAPVNGNSNPLDDNGHGTHVAGIIGAAGNNNLGVVGSTGMCNCLPASFWTPTEVATHQTQ